MSSPRWSGPQLGDPPLRDIITTRTGRLTVALTRFAPRRLVERTILRTVGTAIRGRNFDGAPEPLRNFALRVAQSGRAGAVIPQYR